MAVLVVQLNHPGIEKQYSYGDENRVNSGFCKGNSKIIRIWNSEPHYRKFIKHKGIYIEKPDILDVKNDILLFWGEWEGYSVFNPLRTSTPNGIHEPFHSIKGRGTQNTDPYVFGDFFKYCICFQTGVMKNLDHNSLILFGTTTDMGFILDTIFVVNSFETARNVNKNYKSLYSQTYIEETLEQLGGTYLGGSPSSTNRIYHSKTWWATDKKELFSYVPCITNDNKNFKKVILPIPPMAKQKVGHPYGHFDGKTPLDVWNYVTNEVIKQGFYLGLKFDEPEIDDNLACGKTPISGDKCGC